MLSNANFVGNENNNIVIVPSEFNVTTLQCTHREGGDYYGTPYHVAGVRLNGADLSNLITALVMRHNELPYAERDSITIELKRVILSEDAIKEMLDQDKRVSPDSQTLPY